MATHQSHAAMADFGLAEWQAAQCGLVKRTSRSQALEIRRRGMEMETTTSGNYYIDRALPLINRARESLGLPQLNEMPKGRPLTGVPEDNPICAALVSGPFASGEPRVHIYQGYPDQVGVLRSTIKFMGQNAEEWNANIRKAWRQDLYYGHPMPWIELPSEIVDLWREFNKGNIPELMAS